MESRGKKGLASALEWTNWLDLVYADTYLLLLLGIFHEKLTAFKSLEGYNQFINGSDSSTNKRHCFYCFLATTLFI